jgi:short-subunit dehydrogenase
MNEYGRGNGSMNDTAILIGNSDGIGFSLTRELLKRGWRIVGMSRSKSPIEDSSYEHFVMEVQEDEYLRTLRSVCKKYDPIALCVYSAGIGEMLDLSNMESEVEIIEVNLLGLIKTVSIVIPLMIERGKGQFIGLSSVADAMLSPEAPSYHASKAGFSNYLEGLALAARPKGVYISNVRFGFVDTKMAKGNVKPFMMSVERATQHLLSCIEKKPVRYTRPRIAIPLVKFRSWILQLKIRHM